MLSETSPKSWPINVTKIDPAGGGGDLLLRFFKIKQLILTLFFRCKVLCCCVGCDEQSKNAFKDIAEIMANFFQGLDLVPTDIAAGLILLGKGGGTLFYGAFYKFRNCLKS